MSGTKAGGVKAAKTNKTRHGAEFYATIGKKGGESGKTGGFASDVVGKDGLTGHERASVAGSKGGSLSRRRPQWQIEAEKRKAEEQKINEIVRQVAQGRSIPVHQRESHPPLEVKKQAGLIQDILGRFTRKAK